MDVSVPTKWLVAGEFVKVVPFDHEHSNSASDWGFSRQRRNILGSLKLYIET